MKGGRPRPQRCVASDVTTLIGDEGCICLSGDLAGTFTVDAEGGTLAFSDGTFVQAVWDNAWRFTPVVTGAAYLGHSRGVEGQDDVVHLRDGLRWMVVGDDYVITTAEDAQ